jgi:zinc protease
MELPNGITVLSRANFNSPSIVLSGYLSAGSLFDPDEKLGLSNFTAMALMRGTARRDFQEIYDALESVGANLGFSGGTHSTGFSGRSLVEDLSLLLELLAESLRQPTFPTDQIERLRAQLLTGLAIRAQDTAEMASLTFDQLVYQGHPYSRPEDGFPETVQAISRDDLVAFHQLFYGPHGLVIAAVGAVEPTQLIDQIAAVLGDWQNPSQPAPASLPITPTLTQEEIRRMAIPGKSQADLVIGTAGPPRSAPDFLAASIGNNILGQFGMYGRIGDVVREQAGLAYYAYSSMSGGIGPGPWYVTAGVDPSNVDQAIDLIRNEISRFVNEPVTAQELADTQTNFIGRLPLSLESNAGVAGALINLERHTLGLDYYQRYADMVRAITPDEILAAARHYLDPMRLGIAVAGP